VVQNISAPYTQIKFLLCFSAARIWRSHTMCVGALMCILCIHGWFYLIMKSRMLSADGGHYGVAALCNSDWPARRRTKCDTSLSARSDFAKMSDKIGGTNAGVATRFHPFAKPTRSVYVVVMFTSVEAQRDTAGCFVPLSSAALLCALHIVTLHRNAQRAPLALRAW
jgi:hypothetical protein